MPLSVINIVLLVVAIYMMLNWKSIGEFEVQPIFFVVLVNLIAELMAFYLIKTKAYGGSAWVYNFSLPVELISYGLLFKRLYTQKRFNQIINVSILIIPFLTLYSFISNKSLYPFHTTVYTFGSIFLLFLTLSFFIKLFIADYFLVNPLKQFYFWVCTGVLLCYLGGFMYLSNLNYLFREYEFLYSNLKSLNFILNCFLYLCIIVSIECLKAFPKSQIQSL